MRIKKDSPCLVLRLVPLENPEPWGKFFFSNHGKNGKNNFLLIKLNYKKGIDIIKCYLLRIYFPIYDI